MLTFVGARLGSLLAHRVHGVVAVVVLPKAVGHVHAGLLGGLARIAVLPVEGRGRGVVRVDEFVRGAENRVIHRAGKVLIAYRTEDEMKATSQ